MFIKQEVKDLIDHGYSDDIIKMSLGLSDLQLTFIKAQIEKGEVTRAPKAVQKSKLQDLRDRYNAIYNSEPEVKPYEPKPISHEERLEILRRLDEVEALLPKLNTKNEIAQRKVVLDIKDLFSFMTDLDLPYDLAKRAHGILSKEDFKRLRERTSITTYRRLNEKFKNKYYDSLNYEINSLETIDELEKLLKDIKVLSTTSYMAFSTIQSKIMAKIQGIRLAKFKDALAIPDETIKDIVDSLLDPNVKAEEVQEKMNKAAAIYFEKRAKMVEETYQNANLARLHAPTMEGSQKQVSHQIIDAIQQTDTDIRDTDFVYRRLIDAGVNDHVAAHSIVKNLSNNSRYEEAEEFVNRVYTNYKDKLENNARRSALVDIRRSQICSFIMRGINANEGSIDNENKYYQTIKRGIEESKIDPHTIILGRTKDGRKNISYADIMDKPKIIVREPEL